MNNFRLTVGGCIMLFILSCFFACQQEPLMDDLEVESRACSIPECDVQFFKTISKDSTCCTFEVRATNNSDCAMRLSIEKKSETILVIVPAGDTYTFNIKLCSGRTSKIRFYHSEGVCFDEEIGCDRESDVLEEEEEEEEEEECDADCNDIVLSQEYRGQTDGCCWYLATVTNNTNCVVQILDTKKTNQILINPGEYSRTYIAACAGENERYYIRILPSDGSDPIICDTMQFSGQCD